MAIELDLVWQALRKVLRKWGFPPDRLSLDASVHDLGLTLEDLAQVLETVLADLAEATSASKQTASWDREALQRLSSCRLMDLSAWLAGSLPLPPSPEADPRDATAPEDLRGCTVSAGDDEIIFLGPLEPSQEFVAEPRATSVPIFFATDREPQPDPRLTVSFGAGRSDQLIYGECVVSVPHDRQLGKLPVARRWPFRFRPVIGKHFLLERVTLLAATDFFGQLQAKVAAAGRREAFVFIHGYNQSFEEAALRTAQLAVDLQWDAAPILYSWPSGGEVRDYVKDAASVHFTTTHLVAFLRDLATRSGAERVNILAHSMGNRALCDCLHLLSEAGGVSGATQLGHVVLAAPDVDETTFRQIAPAIRRTAATVTIYISSKDRALRLSRRINGAERLGQRIVIFPGIDTFDASNIDTDFLQHGYFAGAYAMLNELYWLFRDKLPLERFNIRRTRHPDGEYYRFATNSKG